MAERRRYLQYSLSPSKPIPSRSLRRYKVHVVESVEEVPPFVAGGSPVELSTFEDENAFESPNSSQDDTGDDSDTSSLWETSSSVSSDTEDNLEEEEHGQNAESDANGQPLYNGSRIDTTVSINILIMCYAKKYGLTQDAFQALIDLIRVHCPEENNCVTSVFKLKSFFREVPSDDGYQPKRFQYCGVCQNIIPERESTCDVEGCRGKEEKLITFDYIPIENQMRQLF